MIVKLSSDITSCCMTDLKAESSLNAGELFCSTGDGQIFAIPLGSYLYVTLVINSIVTTYCSCFFSGFFLFATAGSSSAC